MRSRLDKIFFEIFGENESKRGGAFEKLSAIATYLVDEGSVRHDSNLRGEFSSTLYQLDVFSEHENKKIMGESKDYDLKGKKVGREDLQKLAGALNDLSNIDEAYFWSATGYTKPAKNYAKSSEKMIGKKVTLWGLKPSTTEDEEGFIKTIVLNLHLIAPDPENAHWEAIFTEESMARLKNLAEQQGGKLVYSGKLWEVYDSEGVVMTTIFDLTSKGYSGLNQDQTIFKSRFDLPGGYISLMGELYEIEGIRYEVPAHSHTETIRITDDSQNRLSLLDSSGNVKRIISDKHIRDFSFDQDGNLIPPQK